MTRTRERSSKKGAAGTSVIADAPVAVYGSALTRAPRCARIEQGPRHLHGRTTAAESECPAVEGGWG